VIIEILNILETAAIAVSGFLIKKYVFLEPDMEEKKQRAFYVVSFFRNRHCVYGFWERYGIIGGIVYDWVKYLSWQEKASFVRSDSDAAVSGHYQRASCSDTACAAVFLCDVDAGDTHISVYSLRSIVCTDCFALCEREKLAQLVSR